MLRTIVVILLLGISAVLFKKLFLDKSNQATTKASATMKKCSQCGIHVPEGKGVYQGDLFFCGEEHKQDYPR